MLSCAEMLSYRYNVIMWVKCYHVEAYVIMWDKMLPSGAIILSCRANIIMLKLKLSCDTKCYHVRPSYHVGLNVIMWDKCCHLDIMLSCGENVIMRKLMLSCIAKYYHLELMLSCGANFFICI
jgi:hypothetical protein